MQNEQASAFVEREARQQVMDLLKELAKGGHESIGALKKLFWEELNYARVNEIRSIDPSLHGYLYEDPWLLASGADGAFHVIYMRFSGGHLSLSEERTIVTKLLSEHPYALFIFSDRAQAKWHFVNVKYEQDNTKRRIYRRITVGPDERLCTATERLSMLDLKRIASRLMVFPLDIQQMHDEAFDVEMITMKFFHEYSKLFALLQRDLFKQTGDPTWAHDYALQFLNRCVFLYFIQRKHWPGDHTEFLERFWRAYVNSMHEPNTFFENWLKVLFFEAFKDKGTGRHCYFPSEIEDILSLTPYLNGGLFAENDLDKHDGFTITDQRIAQILLFLEHYNFTITENNPFDQEVTVDPEMMGKVYESLINVSTQLDERSGAGIFYTPRIEIDLMCRLSLVEYLSAHLGSQNRSLLYDAIFAIEPENKEMADGVLNQHNLWRPVYELLEAVTVVDPACGSGAFLVGMLYVLDDLMARTEKYYRPFVSDERERAYLRKRNIIEHSLYGVDVMQWAVRVAELRLWLALIVDISWGPEELHGRRRPLLPLVTFKLYCGDSLVQKFGDIDFGHNQSLRGLKPVLKQHVMEFVEVFAKKQGFDIVIGNPPYVRQEEIVNPLLPLEVRSTKEKKQEYKQELARSISRRFPSFFAHHELSGKCDLYIYFYLYGLSLLNERGVFSFITSNSWLDVGYGAILQEFLLKHCQIKLVLDNEMRRSFSTASVNTVITLLSAPDENSDWGLKETVRFVMCKVPFEQMLSPELMKRIATAQGYQSLLECRIHPIKQQVLFEDGLTQPEAEADEGQETTCSKRRGKRPTTCHQFLRPRKYTGSKWGGKYLRAPDIYWTIIEKSKDKLVRLSDIAEVRRGITTGVNEFFYLDNAAVRRWGIEQEFLCSVIKSPRECRNIMLDASMLKLSIFMCHKAKDELKGTAALDYIEWGEQQGYHHRPSCASRPRWWDLGERRTPYLGFNYLIDSTARTLYTASACYFSDNFQEVHVDTSMALSLCASLNSTMFQLMVNVAGRANFGEGLLKIQTYEVSNLLCVNPEKMAFQDIVLFESGSWDVLAPSPERLALDEMIFDGLDLTQDERGEVYEAVKHLIEMRLQKASTFNQPKQESPASID
jgi:hypothetical protein